MRRDAARNRTLLLDAAREVFAARGFEASLDEIARSAGVGVGTAYRHFSNKNDLAAALFTEDFDVLVASAHEALSIGDPWDALVAFIEDTAARHAGDRGLFEIFAGKYPVADDPDAEEIDKLTALRIALTEPVTELLARAQRAGVVRGDAAPTDIAAMFIMLGSLYDMSTATDPELWRRYLWLLLDGLRATSASPLPVRALSLTELDTALQALKII